MILLDGVYAVLGLLVTWLLLMASGLAQSEPSHRYPYGRESLTPLVIGVQGFVLLATLGYAAVDAVLTIRNGGSSVDPGWAIVYSVLTTAGSVVTWLWLRSKARTSDVLGSESTAWKIGALRGAGMIVGFTLLAVIVGLIARLGGAVHRSRDGAGHVCGLHPRADRHGAGDDRRVVGRRPVRRDPSTGAAAIDEVRHDSISRRPTVLMSKVGPKLYVEIDGVVDPDVTSPRNTRCASRLRSASMRCRTTSG